MQIIFYLPAALFLISGFPQMVKLLKTKSSKDISIWMYLLTCIGIGIVVVDAYMSRNNSIFISNLASLIITGTNTFLIIRYRKKLPEHSKSL
jgi:uncharacterized protein with PQ loop repeat